MGPETQKLHDWYEAEKAKGLIDIHFSTAVTFGMADQVQAESVEDFCKEVNEMLAAPDVPGRLMYVEDFDL